MTEAAITRPETWGRAPNYVLASRSGAPFLTPNVLEEIRERGSPITLWPTLEEVRLPVDVHLRVADLDPGDEDAVLTFVRDYGPLGVALRGHCGLRGTGVPSRLEGRLEDLRARRSALIAPERLLGEFVEETRLGILQMRALVALRLELQRPRFSARRLAAAWPDGRTWWRTWWRHAPQSRATAQAFLVSSLNAGLDLRAEVAVFGGGREVRWGISTPESLFALACMEMADHLAAGRHIRPCARCGRLFVFQEGRSNYDIHRRDARFCSKRCAWAAMQHRRRHPAG